MLFFWVICSLIAALFLIPWTLISGDARRLYGAGIWIGRTGVRLAGITIESQGLEKLEPQETYIFMSNHVSLLDPPVLIPLIPGRSSVLSKKEIFRIPILGLAMRLGRLVPVDRSSREDAIASLRAAAEVLRDGIHMTIFVEGTRSPDGRLLPFKKGPFHLAMQTGVPVVPVTILGTHDALPKGRFSVQPGIARVIFHSPLQPSAFAGHEELLQAVRASIAGAL